MGSSEIGPEADRLRRSAIAEFWRSVEIFSTNRLEKVDPQRWRFSVRSAAELPWHDDHYLRRRNFDDDLLWRHTVYGGIFTMDRMYQTLETVFGQSGSDVDERVPRGDSAVFAIRVTEDGRLLLDSLVITTAAWAAGRAVTPGPNDPDWLDGFDKTASRIADSVRALLAAAEDDKVASDYLARDGVTVSRPIGLAELQTVLALIVEQLHLGPALEPAGLRVTSERVGRKKATDTQPDLLNSFYLQDLEKVAEAAAAGDVGPALVSYLAAEHTVQALPRTDVRVPADYKAQIERLAPARTPAGRWPANAAHPLASSQQLAINEITGQLGDGAGLFGVNGPPGTGKTTMLRDLVASQVVQRARLLAGLRTPTAAFSTENVGWNTERGPCRIRPLLPHLTGFEMVVASMNNGAIDNVVKEVPQVKAIDEMWAGQSDYFAEHESRILDAPAWALIAAPLGNKSNRDQFADRFWWGRTADRQAPAQPGFLDWLKKIDTPGAVRQWSQAVEKFRVALRTEEALRDERQRAHEALSSLPGRRRVLAAADQALATAAAVRDQAQASTIAAARRAATAGQHDEMARRRWQEHLAGRPGGLEILFTFGRAIRRWRAADEPFQTASTAAYEAATAATGQAHAAERGLESAQQATQTAAVQRDDAYHQVRAAESAVDRVRQVCAGQVPDTAWLSDKEQREIKGPWLDEQWNSARTRVFLSALDLHAAFIAANAGIFRNNLRAMMDILTGKAPGDLPETSLRAAWQTLFLITPVVSTTFASVERMFGGLGREAIGWLLIDEAGQATPQAALGAIWRARRVVAVGDPLQLEPIVGVLHTTQQKQRRHHGVAEIWLPGLISVQTCADRITTLGTELPGRLDTQIWVGAPLRVHRRCDNPMFDIFNNTVYQGLMISAVVDRPHPLDVRESSWIDVAALDAEGNWIPEETRTADVVLKYLTGQGIDPADIMALSPFRDTAYHLNKLGKKYPKLVSGTVHVAQGKEAEVVLFVLGGNPAKRGGRAWAASGPNLFNVAVSRAKQRLYVIGNRDQWLPLSYFNALAELPRRPLK